MPDAQNLSNETERELEEFLRSASSIGSGQDSSVPEYVGEDQEIKPPSFFETANLSDLGGGSSDIVNNIFIFLMSGSTLTISRDTILSSYNNESDWSISIPISSLAYNSGGTIAYDTNTALNVGTGSSQSIARIPIIRGSALVNAFGSYKEGLICINGQPVVEYYKI
jgi:hypothetical protein